MVFRKKRGVLVKSKTAFQIYLIILYTIFFAVSLNTSEAQPSQVCCEETTSGASCVYTSPSNCAPGSAQSPTVCEATTFCSVGCCVNQDEGACYAGVPFANCVNQGNSSFVASPSCNIPECQTGCCTAGNACTLETQQTCLLQAQAYPNLAGAQVWFPFVNNSNSCQQLCQAQETGCCIDFVGGCSRTTRGLCPSEPFTNVNGTLGFYQNTFCSDPSLNCACESHYEKRCLEGEEALGEGGEDVYWFDSCGNREDVAEDCDYYNAQTKCGYDLGNTEPYCKSLNCQDTQEFYDSAGRDMTPSDPRVGGFRYNGEAWCTFESGVGDYLDRPGSRHYRHYCIEGEEKVEACRDKREEVCASTSSTLNGSYPNGYGFAECFDNDIYLSNFTQNVTTVVKGEEFWEGENANQCYRGTTSCTVVWVKKSSFSSWKCAANCECEEQAYVDNMIRYCKLQGDCGMDVNVLGEGDRSGVKITWEGTGKGNHPRDKPEYLFEEFRQYGLFGGMLNIGEALRLNIEEATQELEAAQLTQHIITGIAGLASAVWSFLLIATNVLAPLGPVGIIIAVVLVVITIVLGFLFASKEARKTITVECFPWQAPPGGNNCERCTEDARYDDTRYDPPVECSEYRCKSLGAACSWVGEETGNPVCAWTDPGDALPPVISPDYNNLEGYGNVSLNIEPIVGAPIGGYRLRPAIDAWQPVTFGIVTDEPSLCRYSHEQTGSYEEMVPVFGDPIYERNHTLHDVSFPGNQNITFYVRCMDVNGNTNDAEYVIEVETNAEPDLTAPSILLFEPGHEGSIPANATEVYVQAYLNEPAQHCLWAEQSMSYDAMVIANNSRGIGCGNDPGELLSGNFSGAFFGNTFPCTGFVHDYIPNQENTKYFACIDLVGNNHSEGIPYTLYGSQALYITSIEPDSGSTVYTSEIELRVTTVGGAEDGRAECRFQRQDYPNPVNFAATNSGIHVQTQTLDPGTYSYSIYCEDIAGNVATNSTNFVVDVDNYAPVIQQIYAQSNNLFVITDEASTCEYKEGAVNFEIGEGNEMIGTMVQPHSLLIVENTYSVRCYDQFDNRGQRVIIHVDSL